VELNTALHGSAFASELQYFKILMLRATVHHSELNAGNSETQQKQNSVSFHVSFEPKKLFREGFKIN
jgi:hypothetical protein